MNFLFEPWQLLLGALSGWVNQRQQRIIEFQALLATAGHMRASSASR